ncbi:methyltransferase domain-containing protein [Mycobacterium sp. CBMA293]|uniref:methyltransferase domain-containing protein n=2 Tax=Mycolicibacterium TaxID=1866885 RepID=UPI001325D2C8|nr:MULTISPECIES: methyltransferase domain-containing protein [unclassified Mycolicibacterium]MUL46199.1 methyltransferase domain-containing protein [Mycolicibacterium sp. CBMA 360]MUL94109.1 methyltransferase domain-containing protein [Mycolicibacterium sp. CBMA 230]MUL58751.1 methyltransferase domain-containing protein [Mycolicibacterium sp. CBMA 335]MUL69145.1 methyltransferase domain-containing protein [Mycolicibacterium sp. CBMA 311]MUM05121.1 SAM-dependent methyltransferase [Mycolicibacte
MFGNLYEQALRGERCWVRHDDGRLRPLPVDSWLGGRRADRRFDRAVVRMCAGATIDLGCGPGRFVARLVKRGIPALGVDLSATAVEFARRSGAPALRRDIFDRLPGTGRWQTVLLADGNIGLGGDPYRTLRRAHELLRPGGRCVAEFDSDISGIQLQRVRLESSQVIGPWFPWASVGADHACTLAVNAGLELVSLNRVGSRVVAELAAP